MSDNNRLFGGDTGVTVAVGGVKVVVAFGEKFDCEVVTETLLDVFVVEGVLTLLVGVEIV